MKAFFKSIRWLWLFSLMAVSACGFHLRGAFELPAEMSSVYISSASTSALLLDLKQILETNGSTIATDATVATATIKIEKEQTAQRVLSVDSSGRAREYELKYTVVYSLSTLSAAEDSTVIIDSKKLELIRDYVYDNQAVLGKSREKNVLLRDMQRDASRLILLQIQAAYRSAARSPTGSKS